MNTDANIAVTDFILAICRWIMSCLGAWAVGWFGEYCYIPDDVVDLTTAIDVTMAWSIVLTRYCQGKCRHQLQEMQRTQGLLDC